MIADKLKSHKIIMLSCHSLILGCNLVLCDYSEPRHTTLIMQIVECIFYSKIL